MFIINFVHFAHLEHAQDRDSSNKVDPHDQLAVNLFWHFTVVGQVTQRLCCWLLKGFCKALMWLEAKKKKEQLSMLWFSFGPPRHLQAWQACRILPRSCSTRCRLTGPFPLYVAQTEPSCSLLVTF